MLLWGGQGYIRCHHMQDTQTVLEEAMAYSPALDARWMRQGTMIGAWITVLPSTLNGKELGGW